MVDQAGEVVGPCSGEQGGLDSGQSCGGGDDSSVTWFHVSLQVGLPLKHSGQQWGRGGCSSGGGDEGYPGPSKQLAGTAALHCPLTQRAVLSGRWVRSHPAVWGEAVLQGHLLGRGMRAQLHWWHAAGTG